MLKLKMERGIIQMVWKPLHSKNKDSHNTVVGHLVGGLQGYGNTAITEK